MISCLDDNISSCDFFHLLILDQADRQITGSCSSPGPPPDGTVTPLRHPPELYQQLYDSVHLSSRGNTEETLAHAPSQKPLVSFSQVTLTWCKRRESITQWWIDYSHASFWEPIFLCELNLKLNLLLLSPFRSDRWMEPVKRSWFESATGGISGQRSIYFQTFGRVQNVDRSGHFL